MNRLVAAVLRSRAHWLLSRWVCLISFRGRRSGRPVCTPTQYANDATGVVIFVGRPETKTWWRNFVGRGAEIDVLIAGVWRPLQAEAVVGSDDVERIRPLLASFVERYPRAAKLLSDGDGHDRSADAVVVHCVRTAAPAAKKAAGRTPE